MTFSTPNIFIGGTKAKAVEVNENFEAIKDELNNHAESIIDIQGAVQDTVDFVNGELKDEFRELIAAVRTKFCSNSGNVNDNGEADLLSASSNEISFKVGGDYAPLIATTAASRTITFENIPPYLIDDVKDGFYTIALCEDKEGKIELVGDVFVQNAQPQPYLGENTIPFMTSASEPRGTVTSLGTFFTANDAAFAGFGSGYIAWTSTSGMVQYNYAKNIEEGDYELSFTLTVDSTYTSSRYFKTIKCTIIYADDTTKEIANLPTGAYNTGTFNFDFTAEKEIKALKLEHTANVSSVTAYMWRIAIKPKRVPKNSLWLKTDKEPIASYKLVNNEWTPYSGIPLGRTYIEDNKIISLLTFPFNQNGFNINSESWPFDVAIYVKESWRSGDSWYRIWSDGWVEQGGLSTATSADIQISLFVYMSTLNYNVHANSTGAGTGAIRVTGRWQTTIILKNTSGNSQTILWSVKGYSQV